MKLLKSFTNSTEFQILKPEDLHIKEINLANISRNEFSYSKLIYRVSQKGLPEVADFSEYSFLHIPDKYKYNSSNILNYFGSEEGEDIIDFFNDLGSIEKYTETLVPTLSMVLDVNSPGIETFGSVYYDNKTFYAIPVSSGNNLVYLFESYIFSDQDQYKFCIYFDKEEEVNQDKILWLIVSSDGTISDINISYYSWKTSNNKFRNLNQYLLRNDDKAKIDTSDPIEIKNDLVFDSTSGTLLGKKTENSTPILDNLISYYKDKDLSKYSFHVSYQVGDKVSYGGKSYYSLISNNIGHNPILSRYWILSDFLDENDIEYHSKIMYIILSEPEAVKNYTQEVILRYSFITLNGHYRYPFCYIASPIILSGVNGYTIDKIYSDDNRSIQPIADNTIDTITLKKGINLDLYLSNSDYLYISLSRCTIDLGNIKFNIHYLGKTDELTLSSGSNNIVSISTERTNKLEPGDDFSFIINTIQGTLDKNIIAVYKGYSDTDILEKNITVDPKTGVVVDKNINTRATEITYNINIVDLVSVSKTIANENFLYFSEYPGFDVEFKGTSDSKISLFNSTINIILYSLDDDVDITKFNGELLIYGENDQPIQVSRSTSNVINIVNGKGSGYIFDKTDVSDNGSGVYSSADIKISTGDNNTLQINFQENGYNPYTNIYLKLENLS